MDEKLRNMVNLIDLKNQYYAYSFKFFDSYQISWDNYPHLKEFVIENYPGAYFSCYAPGILYKLFLKWKQGMIIDDYDRHPLRKELLPQYKEHRYEYIEGKYGVVPFPGFLKYLKFHFEDLRFKMRDLGITDFKYALAISLFYNRVMLRDFLKNFTCYYIAEYEADDVIAHLAREIARSNIDVNIVSTDKDYYQLWDEEDIRERVYINTLSCSDVKTPRYGFLTTKALLGDKSDNIPKSLERGKGKKYLEKKGFAEEDYDKELFENNLKVIRFGDEYLGERDKSFIENFSTEDTLWNFYDFFYYDPFHELFLRNIRKRRL